MCRSYADTMYSTQAALAAADWGICWREVPGTYSCGRQKTAVLGFAGEAFLQCCLPGFRMPELN